MQHLFVATALVCVEVSLPAALFQPLVPGEDFDHHFAICLCLSAVHPLMFISNGRSSSSDCAPRRTAGPCVCPSFAADPPAERSLPVRWRGD